MGHNTSELDSASLRYMGVTKHPDVLKSEVDDEEMPERNHRTPRGGWRWHLGKEKSRNLRDPEGVDTLLRESDDPIVAKKGLIHLEPRGWTTNVQPRKRSAAD